MMPDMEKVVKGLECCSVKHNCTGCPYFKFDASCQDDMNKDALELLKEQSQIVRCKDCKHSTDDVDCPIWLNRWKLKESDNWFCADGEKRE